MAVVPIFPVLLLAVITRCKCDYSNGFNTYNGNSASQFGAILKPPPPPQLAPLPFHRGTERNQRQNTNAGYQYPTPTPLQSSIDFKFPAPFYKQYNFNFVPPPQPFSTTPSPSTFQKITGWLFPSQQTSYTDTTIFNSNVGPIKKDCNPCNLVPWLPVIRYNAGAKSVKQNSLPTYGPPSPTAYADALKAVQKYPQPFNNQQNQYTTPAQLNPAVPHMNYGPPDQNFHSDVPKLIGSTYGPPSATHTVDILTPSPLSSIYSQPSSSYEVPTSTFVLPTNSINSQFTSTPSQELSNDFNKFRITTHGPPFSSYGTPLTIFNTPRPLTSTYGTVSPEYEPGTLNKELSSSPDNVEVFDNITPTNEQQVPKTTSPIIFKNSYGDPITNTKVLDISYPISASAAETKKVNTQVLPNENVNSSNNLSFMLFNPAPFTSNRGRNIHTLQPVALPNLSVSLLPPIFNARPFRTIVPPFPSSVLQGINQMQSSNVNIQQSIPVVEFTHSVDYPATIIQSPIIEIDPPSISNKTKGYRGITSNYVVDEIRDISSQASEDHISATKTISDASIEITGTDVGNELYDNGIPTEMRLQPSFVTSNHKTNFADLSGVNDEDVDKYRSENNLQNIDSPLLYLKPSAPHKSYGNFVLAISSPIPNNEYEIYDDISTTAAPQIPTLITSWDESKTKFDQDLTSLPVEKHKYKPKIVQIIVPYTTNNNEKENYNEFIQTTHDWTSTPKDEYLARKVPSNEDGTHITTVTENYSTESSMKEEVSLPAAELNTDRYNPMEVNKDDVNDPPFDIIKLQHAIDDWTVQEYSKQYLNPQRTHNNEKYAKKIPDDYFTTTEATHYGTTSSNSNYEFYDHEGSSSVQYTVTDDTKNNTSIRKKYNTINRHSNSKFSGNQEVLNEVDRLHIYTASSSFRKTTTTTPAPWGELQTSISPLTKEKVYVVTSKPWKESNNITKERYDVKQFESMKILADSEPSASTSNLLFKSPRFISRPSFGFSSGGKIESDSSYGYSKKWYEDINALGNEAESRTSSPPTSQLKDTAEYKDTSGTTEDSHR